MIFEKPMNIQKKTDLGRMINNPSAEVIGDPDVSNSGKHSKTTKAPKSRVSNKDDSSSNEVQAMFLPNIEEHKSPSKTVQRELIELDAVQAEAHEALDQIEQSKVKKSRKQKQSPDVSMKRAKTPLLTQAADLTTSDYNMESKRRP